MKNIIGFLLIDAPFSALNNADTDAGSRTENTVAVKVIRKGKENYPYVSAQAWRYWWRNTLKEKYNWGMSPITRDEKIAFTEANPFKYIDDDLFGYMRAKKKTGRKNKKETQDKEDKGALTRISPLKNSPLISVYNQNPTSDYGVMARQEDNPVPYEHQFYSVVLKGIFSVDLTNAGVFGLTNRAGYRNLSEEHIKETKIQDAIKESNAVFSEETKQYIIGKEHKIKRLENLLTSLSYMSGGAKQALHHTDVTPKFIVLMVIEGGNNILMNIVNEDIANDYTKKILNVEALKSVLADYKDIIKSDIFIGRNGGFQDSLKEELTTLCSNDSKIKVNTVKSTLESFSTIIKNHIV
jgi:CRISPR-associated protein Cst2